MKKLLSIISAFCLTASSVTTVVCCTNPENSTEELNNLINLNALLGEINGFNSNNYELALTPNLTNFDTINSDDVQNALITTLKQKIGFNPQEFSIYANSEKFIKIKKNNVNDTDKKQKLFSEGLFYFKVLNKFTNKFIINPDTNTTEFSVKYNLMNALAANAINSTSKNTDGKIINLNNVSLESAINIFTLGLGNNFFSKILPEKFKNILIKSLNQFLSLIVNKYNPKIKSTIDQIYATINSSVIPMPQIKTVNGVNTYIVDSKSNSGKGGYAWSTLYNEINKPLTKFLSSLFQIKNATSLEDIKWDDINVKNKALIVKGNNVKALLDAIAPDLLHFINYLHNNYQDSNLNKFSFLQLIKFFMLTPQDSINDLNDDFITSDQVFNKDGSKIAPFSNFDRIFVHLFGYSLDLDTTGYQKASTVGYRDSTIKTFNDFKNDNASSEPHHWDPPIKAFHWNLHCAINALTGDGSAGKKYQLTVNFGEFINWLFNSLSHLNDVNKIINFEEERKKVFSIVDYGIATNLDLLGIVYTGHGGDAPKSLNVSYMWNNVLRSWINFNVGINPDVVVYDSNTDVTTKKLISSGSINTEVFNNKTNSWVECASIKDFLNLDVSKIKFTATISGRFQFWNTDVADKINKIDQNVYWDYNNQPFEIII